MKEKAQAEIIFLSDQNTGDVQYKQLSVPVPGARYEISVACGYRRCLDFDSKNAPGQDFASVCSGEGFVVGVVADGVSQSFYGDIAALAVGKALVNLLWKRRENPPEEAQVEQRLNEIVEQVQRAVLEKPLPFPPDSIPGQALERTRAKGSQAFFSAFIFDGARRDLHLYQVGDTLAWIHYGNQPVEAPTVNTGRWSSVNQNGLGLQKLVRTGVAGVVVHSDGLRRSWAEQLERPHVSREDFEKELDAQAAVDDLSFISVAVTAQRRQPLAPSPVAPRPKQPIGPVQNGCLRDDRSKDDRTEEEGTRDRQSHREEEKASGRPVPRGRSLLRLAAVFAMGLLIGAFLTHKAQERPAERRDKGQEQSDREPPPLEDDPVFLAAKDDTEVDQKVFQADKLPAEIQKVTKEGDIVARLDVQGVYVGRAEVRGPKDEKAFVSSPEQAVFVRVPGRGESDPADPNLDDAKGRWTPVVIELFDAAGKPIFKQNMKLRGRQRKARKGETDRFLGYHEIRISPKATGPTR